MCIRDRVSTQSTWGSMHKRHGNLNMKEFSMSGSGDMDIVNDTLTWLRGLVGRLERSTNVDEETVAHYEEILRGLKHIVKNLHEQDSRVKALQAELSTLTNVRRELERIHRRESDLERDLSSKDKELWTLRATVQNLEERLRRAETEKETAEREVTQIGEKYSALRSTFERNAELLSKMESEIAANSRNVDRQLDSYLGKERNFADEVSRLTFERDRLKEDILAKENKLVELLKIVEENEQSRHDVRDLIRKFEETAEENRALKDERRMMEQQLRDSGQANAEITRLNAIVQEQISILEASKLKLIEQENLIARFRGENNEKELTIIEKTGKLKKLGTEMRIMNEKVMDIGGKCEKLMTENVALKRQLEQMEQREEMLLRYRLQSGNKPVSYTHLTLPTIYSV
eukprot:TRINITY_DN1270_c0_g2_i1.p1 TRINITY_DN1270_c0_g2~~TRINITY_DN1270_c0_g2_i1.p1  ORF type:complete len:403 (+),score=113.62 TRINITY_DN1270_c0_g2_i1:66-1274(+)